MSLHTIARALGLLRMSAKLTKYAFVCILGDINPLKGFISLLGHFENS